MYMTRKSLEAKNAPQMAIHYEKINGYGEIEL